MQHRKVVLGGQLAGLGAIAGGLLLVSTGEVVLGTAVTSAAFVSVAGSTWALARARKPVTVAAEAPAAAPAPAVGRLAALDGNSAEDPRSYLGELILGRQTAAADSRPAILVIAGSGLVRRLEAFGPVIPLLPGTAAAQIRQGAPSMLVIDRRCLETGVWAHTETGAGSVLFRELAEIIRQCQGLHIATILLDCANPDRFYTSTLRKLCRNVMPLAREDLHPEGTAASDMLTELQTWSMSEPVHVR